MSSTKPSSNSLIFDCFGVLFFLNKKRLLYQIGPWNVIKFSLFYRRNPVDACLSLLEHMRNNAPNEFQDLIAYRGFYLPASLCKWQRGLLSNTEVMQRVCSYLEALNNKLCPNKPLMLTVAKLLFCVPSLLKSIQPNRLLMQQIKTLKQSHRIFMLSNMDKEMWEQLSKKYQSFFDVFDGMTMSHSCNLLKPSESIYHHLCSTYNLDPHTCVMIDDQKENLETAQSLGMKILLYKKAIQVSPDQL